MSLGFKQQLWGVILNCLFEFHMGPRGKTLNLSKRCVLKYAQDSREGSGKQKKRETWVQQHGLVVFQSVLLRILSAGRQSSLKRVFFNCRPPWCATKDCACGCNPLWRLKEHPRPRGQMYRAFPSHVDEVSDVRATRHGYPESQVTSVLSTASVASGGLWVKCGFLECDTHLLPEDPTGDAINQIVDLLRPPIPTPQLLGATTLPWRRKDSQHENWKLTDIGC